MGRGGEWSADEDAALRALVSLHSCRWAAVAAVLGTRSAASVRGRWSVLRAFVVPVVVGAVDVSVAFPWGVGGGGVEGLPEMLVLRDRWTGDGQSWEYVVQVSRRVGVRSGPPPRQARLISNWGLGDGGLLLCSLRDAEERLRHYLRARGVPLLGLNAAVLEFVVSLADRDTLGMVHYPGEGCRTLTSNNAPY